MTQLPPEPEDIEDNAEEDIDEPPHTPEQFDDYSLKHLALAYHLEVDPDDLDETKYDDSRFDEGRSRSYLVLTSDEANERVEDSVRELGKEMVEERIPDDLQIYFDLDKWVEETASQTDNGSELAGYDGHEYEIRTNTEAFRKWVTATFGIPTENVIVVNDDEMLCIYRTN